MDFDIRNTCKMFLVVRQHSEIIMQGSCPEQNIKIRNQFPPSPQERPDFGKLFYDGKVLLPTA